MTVETIHKLADRLGVSWDGDKHFMKWCSQLVGKEHLDDMSQEELLKIYNRLRTGSYGKIAVEMNDADYVMDLMKKNTREKY